MPELPTIQSTSTRRVRRYRNGEAVDVEDYLVVEEPLEIRVGDRRFTVTMRTPGDDFDLVRGLLFTEGLINSADDIGQMRYCDAVDLPPAPSSRGGDIDSDYDNIVVVRLKSEVDWAGRCPCCWRKRGIRSSQPISISRRRKKPRPRYKPPMARRRPFSST